MHNRVSMAFELLKSADYNYNQKLRIEFAKLLNKRNDINIESKKRFNINNILSTISAFAYNGIQKHLPQKYKTISKVIRKKEIEYENVILEIILEQMNSLSNLTLDKLGYRDFSFRLYSACINVKYGYSIIKNQMLYSSRNFDETNSKYEDLINFVEDKECIELIDLLIDENNNKVDELMSQNNSL